MNSILKAYTLKSYSFDEKNDITIDNCIFYFEEINEELLHLKDIKIIKIEDKKEKFVFNLTLHFLERVFERNLKYFDWSILCNIYKEALKSNHIKSFKYEICNSRSTCEYAIDNNTISIITGWNGIR